MVKRTTKIMFVAIFLITGFFSGVVLPGAASCKELKLAHFMPPMHILHRKVFTPLAEELSKATNGDLTIKIYPSGALGKGPVQQYKRVVEGVADITFCIEAYTASIFPRSLLVTQPGVAHTAEEGTHKLWSIYDTYLAGEYKAVKVLGIWVMSPASLMTRKKPVRALADIKNMKVRISSPILTHLIKSWGAVPVAMPVTETYNALNTGIVDAVVLQPSALYRPWNLAEPAKYVTDNFPGPSSVILLAMNKKSWEGLSNKQRAALDKLTGRQFSINASVIWGSLDIKGLEKAKSDPNIEYIKITASQRTGFTNAAMPGINEDLDKLEKKGINAREIFKALTR
jgi:TRAP-type C4-dicarboxylate transport system substrate-binding protein